MSLSNHVPSPRKAVAFLLVNVARAADSIDMARSSPNREWFSLASACEPSHVTPPNPPCSAKVCFSAEEAESNVNQCKCHMH